MSLSKKTLRDLLETGEIQAGTDIFMKSAKGQRIRAIITDSGKIQLESGELFNSPSSAARYLRQGTSANGWKTWRFESDSRPIGVLRFSN